MTTLYQISYNDVCAALLVDASGKCVIGPGWLLGRSITQIRAQCEQYGYFIEQLDEALEDA